MGERSGEPVEIVVRALSPAGLRAQSARVCRQRFPAGGWRLSEPVVRPCLVSLGGRVRLWEGRFEVTAR